MVAGLWPLADIMTMVWKVVKPARLKEDAFRLYMLNSMRRSGTEIKQEHQKTTATWNKKPMFSVTVSLKDGRFTVTVLTGDKIYGYVDKGTPPHVILPKKVGGKLRFNSKFVAKTVPGVVGSLPGYSAPPVVFSSGVFHPGTEARDFTTNIEKVYRPKFRKNCEEAMRQFAKGSGHYAGRR